MEVVLLPEAQNHLKYWKKTGNVQVQNKITSLIQEILNLPYTGIGKPEALKYQLTGKWSRRINQEHRIIYAIQNNKLYIYSLKGHY